MIIQVFEDPFDSAMLEQRCGKILVSDIDEVVNLEELREAVGRLKDADLMVSINACPEFKGFVNTILQLCDKSKVIP